MRRRKRSPPTSRLPSKRPNLTMKSVSTSKCHNPLQMSPTARIFLRRPPRPIRLHPHENQQSKLVLGLKYKSTIKTTTNLRNRPPPKEAKTIRSERRVLLAKICSSNRTPTPVKSFVRCSVRPTKQVQPLHLLCPPILSLA